MTKRRRERDRPKAAHDALYNPNKRVLLSYASDEEVEDGEVELKESGADVRPIEPPTSLETAQERDESTRTSSRDSSAHRELFEEAWQEDDASDGEEEEQVVKNNAALWSRSTTKNPTTGQWATLGSLSYQWEEEGEYDEDEDYDSTEEEAMSYLRAVRYERQGIPMVLKAAESYSDQEIYDSGLGDTRGYYEDGAYVARASLGPQLPETQSEDSLVSAQEAFTFTVKQRFLKHCQQLHLSPDPAALKQLDEKHPISFPVNNSKAYGDWLRLLRSTTPLPAQIRAIPQSEVFRLLELLQRFYLKRDTEIATNLSSWVWALLARLDDVGGMDNDQVSIVRELGKKAIVVQLSFNDSAAAKELEGVAANVHSEPNASAIAPSNPSEIILEDGEIANTEDPSAQSSNEATTTNTKDLTTSPTRQNTLATLDTILVIVGEIFGQHDLLEFRTSWNTATAELNGT